MDSTGAAPATVATLGSLPWQTAALQQTLERQRGHALLVHGPGSAGQFEFALQLAAAWLCEGHDDTPGDAAGHRRACGTCPSCRLIAARSHPDLHWVIPEALRAEAGFDFDEEGQAEDGSRSKRKPSREIRIDQIRAAVDFSALTSSRGRGRVVLIHPAEQINAIAANALLKTLEEPAGALRFVLACGAVDSLLPTLRSRCQSVRLPSPDRAQALEWLNARQLPAHEAAVLLDASGGEPLRALALAQAGLDAAAWQALPLRVASGEATALQGWPLPLLVEALQKLCHDQMLCCIGSEPRYFTSLRSQGSGLMQLTRWAIDLREHARQAEHPWQVPLSIEALLVQAQRAMMPSAPIHSRA
jgi:DNA polymerase-3 subunit delta'